MVSGSGIKLSDFLTLCKAPESEAKKYFIFYLISCLRPDDHRTQPTSEWKYCYDTGSWWAPWTC